MACYPATWSPGPCTFNRDELRVIACVVAGLIFYTPCCPHSYEQFKWAPVWLSLMLLLVPLSLDGKSLDKWMFALVFHAAYLCEC